MMLSDLYSKKSLLYLTNEHQTKVLNLKNYPIINGKIESFLGIGNVTTVIDIIISWSEDIQKLILMNLRWWTSFKTCLQYKKNDQYKVLWFIGKTCTLCSIILNSLTGKITSWSLNTVEKVEIKSCERLFVLVLGLKHHFKFRMRLPQPTVKLQKCISCKIFQKLVNEE